MRPQMAASYGPQRGPGIPGMAKAMGMGRFREPNAGRVSGSGPDMARMAVGSAPSDQTAAAFLRALGGVPATGNSMPGLNSGYQNELQKMSFAMNGGPNMNPVVARRQVDSHEFAQAPMRPVGDGRQSHSENMALVPRVWKSSPDHDPAILAYVTPKEMDMLREADIYDSNISERMHFGPEYVPSLQGDGVGGGDSGSGGGGGGGTDTGPGGANDSPDGAGTQGGNTGAGGAGLGANGGIGGAGFGGGGSFTDLGPAIDVGSAPGAGRPSVSEAPEGPDVKGTSMDPGYPGGPQGSYAGTPGTVGRGGESRPNVSGYGFNPNMGMSVLSGFLNAVSPGISVTRGLNALGVKSDAEKTGQPDSAPETGATGSGADTGSPFVKPSLAASGSNALTRPAAMDAPSFLDFESDDPLQRRSKIATFATQGTGGKWATDEAFNYWKNLTQRDLISDAGQMPDFANLLGTELGYLGSRGIAAPNQTRALLEAILSA